MKQTNKQTKNNNKKTKKQATKQTKNNNTNTQKKRQNKAEQTIPKNKASNY